MFFFLLQERKNKKLDFILKTNVKYALLLFLTLSVLGCKKDVNNEKEEEVTIAPKLELSKPEEETKSLLKKDLIITGEEFEELLDDQCGIENIKVYDIYDHKEVLDDANERSFVVQKLKSKGYEILSWARGNSASGPRVISYELKKDDCICHVVKWYNNTTVNGQLDIFDTVTCF